MTKQFICVWLDRTYQAEIAVHQLDFFTEDLGYYPSDIREVAALEPGETYLMDDHYVMCIPSGAYRVVTTSNELGI